MTKKSRKITLHERCTTDAEWTLSLNVNLFYDDNILQISKSKPKTFESL